MLAESLCKVWWGWETRFVDANLEGQDQGLITDAYLIRPLLSSPAIDCPGPSQELPFEQLQRLLSQLIISSTCSLCT